MTNLRQMNQKRALVDLYKDILLVTRARIFCTALLTNNNIKVVIKIDAFLAHQIFIKICLSLRLCIFYNIDTKCALSLKIKTFAALRGQCMIYTQD